MKKLRVVELLKSGEIGSEVQVRGWVRTKRGNKNIAFIAVNDGSVIHNIQVVAEAEKFEEELKQITTGACVVISGTLVASQGSGQAFVVNDYAIVVV
jgi:asparaginyl-tRNA synthetase